MKTDGPKFRLAMSCFDCKHCTSESYAVQGDSGHDVYCEHPSIDKKRIGDTRWDTPPWCPVLPASVTFSPATGERTFPQ